MTTHSRRRRTVVYIRMYTTVHYQGRTPMEGSNESGRYVRRRTGAT